MRRSFATWKMGSLPADGRTGIQPGDGGQRHCCQRPGSSLRKGTRIFSKQSVLRLFWGPEIMDCTNDTRDTQGPSEAGRAPPPPPRGRGPRQRGGPEKRGGGGVIK
jgi:hypothetical protein